MPLEVPLGELAVAPVNPVHEEVVRSVFFSSFPFVSSKKNDHEQKTHFSHLVFAPSSTIKIDPDHRRALQP